MTYITSSEIFRQEKKKEKNIYKRPKKRNEEEDEGRARESRGADAVTDGHRRRRKRKIQHVSELKNQVFFAVPQFILTKKKFMGQTFNEHTFFFCHFLRNYRKLQGNWDIIQFLHKYLFKKASMALPSLGILSPYFSFLHRIY